VRVVEEARAHRDQLASPAGPDHLHREPAAGFPDQRGHGDAQRALHALGHDVDLDRCALEPACRARFVEADERGDRRGRGLGVLALGGLGDPPEARHLPLHRRVARERHLRPVASLDLALLRRVEVDPHVQRVGRGLGDPVARPRGSSELAGDLGDSHRPREEDGVAQPELAGRVEPPAALEPLERGLRAPGEALAGQVEVAVELTDVAPRIAFVDVAIGRHRAAQEQHRAVVHPIEHAAAADLGADLGQRCVRPARLVDDGVRRAVRSRPVTQGPVEGDDGRERPALHRGRARRRLRGRARLGPAATGRRGEGGQQGDHAPHF
jgi:hypothetical protein